jgi:hypothetical protein
MKGALLVCSRSVALLAVIRDVAEDRGLRTAQFEGSLQIADGSGRLLTAFADEVPDSEWKGTWDFTSCAEFDHRAYSIECRWEDLFCDVVRDVGARLPCVLVIDSDGQVFAATVIDPSSINL